MANVDWSNVEVGELLLADSFGYNCNINKNGSKPEPIVNTLLFFQKLYTSTNRAICVYDDSFSDIWRRNYLIEKFINKIKSPKNSTIVFVEGFAGCGKTVFVQNILYKILNSTNYVYSFYNYDIGSDEENPNIIFDTIINQFIERFLKIISEPLGMEIYQCFKKLSSYDFSDCLEIGRGIYYKFVCVKSIDEAVNEYIKNPDDNFRISVVRVLYNQICKKSNNFTLLQIFALDYLWRLAQWIVLNKNKKELYMHICYDNLDSIPTTALSGFTNELRKLRSNIDAYINKLNENTDDFKKYSIDSFPHAVFFATFRKVTAAKIDLKGTEKLLDSPETRRYIMHIDISDLYKYIDVVNKRLSYYINYVETIPNEDISELKDRLLCANEIVKMDFVKNYYSSLWNNNFRICNDIVNAALYSYENELSECISMCKSKIDNFNKEQIASCSGASALFFAIICRLYRKDGAWDSQCMDVIDNQKIGYPALTRLILTYLHNCKKEGNKYVNITRIYDKFKVIYSIDDICFALSHMLTRRRNKLWRRPIYYCQIDSNDVNELGEKIKYILINHEHKIKCDEFIEVELCKSGCAFVEIVSPQFEFFASKQLKNLSPILSDAKGNIEKLELIISEVYKSVERCCQNIKKFRTKYMELKKIDDMHYLYDKIHPRTRNGNPQLYEERVIFSHIDYLNNCRMILINKNDDYIKYNKLFVEQIKKYFELYKKYIKDVSNQRAELAGNLEKIADKIRDSKYIDKTSITTRAIQPFEHLKVNI